jgi:hypothetical protein
LLKDNQNVKFFTYEYEKISERLNELQQTINEYIIDLSNIKNDSKSLFFNQSEVINKKRRIIN